MSEENHICSDHWNETRCRELIDKCEALKRRIFVIEDAWQNEYEENFHLSAEIKLLKQQISDLESQLSHAKAEVWREAINELEQFEHCYPDPDDFIIWLKSRAAAELEEKLSSKAIDHKCTPLCDGYCTEKP